MSIDFILITLTCVALIIFFLAYVVHVVCANEEGESEQRHCGITCGKICSRETHRASRSDHGRAVCTVSDINNQVIFSTMNNHETDMACPDYNTALNMPSPQTANMTVPVRVQIPQLSKSIAEKEFLHQGEKFRNDNDYVIEGLPTYEQAVSCNSNLSFVV